jgi:hypothetical protein
VFINCPYDSDYLPLLQAMVFAVHACGFVARLAMLEAGSQLGRLDRLVDLVRSCRFGIHDLSRVQWTGDDILPRFNMPFELGMAYGAFRLGTGRCRQMQLLVLEAEAYRHQHTLSDIAGLDGKVHGNSADALIGCVRDFLADHVDPRPVGATRLRSLYEEFRAELPRLATDRGLTLEELMPLERFRDWYAVSTQWLAFKASGQA